MRQSYSTISGLATELWNNVYTMVEIPRYTSMDLIVQDIKSTNIQGDIVDCGVWRGGTSIYLANAFLDRIIWICDSFEGFQPIISGTYLYKDDRHTQTFDKDHPDSIRGGGLSIKVPIEQVKNNLKKFGFDDDNIKYLKGWVKDTLDIKICPIQKIALLRIDVDAYSATLEVLDNLYDKVVSGGYIIFDDTGLPECDKAIKDFKQKRNLNFKLIYPPNCNGLGGYFKKD